MTLTQYSVLASSLKLEYPLSDAVPSTSNARDRLLAKMFQYRKDAAAVEDDTISAKDEDYEMIYAYILVTGQLAEEIQKVEKLIEDLYGVMDEDMLKLQWGGDLGLDLVERRWGTECDGFVEY